MSHDEKELNAELADDGQVDRSAVTQCGHIAIVGRPNVGKSTFLNHVLGKKISITSRRPQTTQRRILGVLTDETTQIVFLDTPGLHGAKRSRLHGLMQRWALRSMSMVDLVLLVVDANRPHEIDEKIYAGIRERGLPCIVALNKIDYLRGKSAMLPLIDAWKERGVLDVVPMSALKNINIDEMLLLLKSKLPVLPFCFPKDMVTDQADGFMITEIIREKMFRTLGAELPYVCAVSIDSIDKEKDKKEILKIHSTIWVEKSSQKSIVIGHQGSMLKKIGSAARRDLESNFECHVFLKLWVKVRKHWSKDADLMKSMYLDVEPEK